MNRYYCKTIFLGAMLVILVTGCAAKNPVASSGGGGGDDTAPASSPSLRFSATGNGDNTVSMRQKSISGTDLWVEVYASNITDNVFGASFHVVFDATKLQYQGYSAGNFFSAGPASVQINPSNNDLTVYVGYDNQLTQSTGSGAIINLHFKAINQGSSDLSFANSHLQNNVPTDITVSGWYKGAVSYSF